MIDVGTKTGRLLAQLKFCAVEVEDGEGNVFIATRCRSVCGRYESDDEGVHDVYGTDDVSVEVAVIDMDARLLGFTIVRSSSLRRHSIVVLNGGNFYLDSRTLMHGGM